MDELMKRIEKHGGEISKGDYIRALRLIDKCKVRNVPYVIEALRRVGFDLPDADTLGTVREANRSRLMNASAVRTADEKMLETDDEVALALRDAYRKGVSLTAISNVCGRGRVCLYQYMVGSRVLKSEELRRGVLDGVKTVMEQLNEAF